MGEIKVFVIDDSAIVREILTTRLGREGEIVVVGTAVDPLVARDKLARVEVDVIILDIEMPRMDGLTFLRHLMRQHPMPVIVMSSVADRDNSAGIEALELGALDIVTKPGGPISVEDVLDQLTESIRTVAKVDLAKVTAPRQPRPASGSREPGALTKIRTTNRIIAMGASTGGTQAYEAVFRRLPVDIPPILAVIHMPPGFTRSFANRLNDLSIPTVREAQDGEPIVPGTIYLAPGDWHMAVRTSGAQRSIKLFQGPRLWSQRPAVDVLFQSVAEQLGRNAVGVLMTGMGRDGADGLLKMKQAGARTICQDEESCIVFGMPKEGIKLGAADQVVSLDKIPEAMLQEANARAK